MAHDIGEYETRTRGGKGPKWTNTCFLVLLIFMN